MKDLTKREKSTIYIRDWVATYHQADNWKKLELPTPSMLYFKGQFTQAEADIWLKDTRPRSRAFKKQYDNAMLLINATLEQALIKQGHPPEVKSLLKRYFPDYMKQHIDYTEKAEKDPIKVNFIMNNQGTNKIK